MPESPAAAGELSKPQISRRSHSCRHQASVDPPLKFKFWLLSDSHESYIVFQFHRPRGSGVSACATPPSFKGQLTTVWGGPSTNENRRMRAFTLCRQRPSLSGRTHRNEIRIGAVSGRGGVCVILSGIRAIWASAAWEEELVATARNSGGDAGNSCFKTKSLSWSSD